MPFLSQMGGDEIHAVLRQVDKGLNFVQTTSAGRLFDAVAAMAGGRGRVTYEAQAAIEMEMVSQVPYEGYGYYLRGADAALGWGDTAALPLLSAGYEVALKPLLDGVIRDVRSGKPLAEVGGRFHRTVAEIVVGLCCILAQSTGLRAVALSGGCFQNRLLLRLVAEELNRRGLQMLLHRQVPTNDGGVSLGQAAIGHFALERDFWG